MNPFSKPCFCLNHYVTPIISVYTQTGSGRHHCGVAQYLPDKKRDCSSGYNVLPQYTLKVTDCSFK